MTSTTRATSFRQCFPGVLLARVQWLLWKLVKRINSNGEIRWDKVPYQTSGKKASTTDPKTWTTFDNALHGLEENPGRYQGIGFVFSKDDPFTGIDIDDAIDADGKLHARARTIVETMESFTEKSQSGKGIHVIVKGKLPSAITKVIGKGVEMYDQGRFFALTGNVLADRVEITERPVEVLEMYYEFKPQSERVAKEYHCEPTDEEVRQLLKNLSQARCDDQLSWVSVGYSLKSKSDNYLPLWDEWSQGSSKYQPGECAKRWARMKPNRISFGSLVYWAREDSGNPDLGKKNEGVRESQPIPDVPPPDPEPSEILTPAAFIHDEGFWRPPPPTTTTFDGLDQLLNGGVRAGFLYVLLAMYKSFKTTVLLNIFRRLGLAHGPVLFISTEETPDLGLRRIIAASAHVPYLPLLDGSAVSEEDKVRIRRAAKTLGDAPLYLSRTRDLGRLCSLVRFAVKAHSVKMVLLDHMSRVSVAGAKTEYESVTRTSEALADLAMECRIPILAAIQANREGAKRGIDGKDLTEADIRASGAVVQDAAATLIIQPPAPGSGRVELRVTVRGSRFGPQDLERSLWVFPEQARVESPDPFE